jgi:hypothetical protein
MTLRRLSSMPSVIEKIPVYWMIELERKSAVLLPLLRNILPRRFFLLIH